MKGLVKVTPESLLDLCEKCLNVIENFDITKQPKKSYKNWSWRKFKNVEKFSYDTPFWYCNKYAVIKQVKELQTNANRANDYGDELWLSASSYTHLVKLSEGDKGTNSTFIIRY